MTAQTYERYVDTKVVVRTVISGVTIGVLGGITFTRSGPVVRMGPESYRLLQWWNAESLSQLAREGAETKLDRHPADILIADQGIEILPIAPLAWERLMAPVKVVDGQRVVWTGTTSEFSFTEGQRATIKRASGKPETEPFAGSPEYVAAQSAFDDLERVTSHADAVRRIANNDFGDTDV